MIYKYSGFFFFIILSIDVQTATTTTKGLYCGNIAEIEWISSTSHQDSTFSRFFWYPFYQLLIRIYLTITGWRLKVKWAIIKKKHCRRKKKIISEMEKNQKYRITLDWDKSVYIQERSQEIGTGRMFICRMIKIPINFRLTPVLWSVYHHANFFLFYPPVIKTFITF